MSSTDDARHRRPEPDRDSFYDKHAHPRGVVTGSSAASAPSGDLPDTVILGDSSSGLPTVEITGAVPSALGTSSSPETSSGPETSRGAESSSGAESSGIDLPVATRTDLRTEADVVVTEPFADLDVAAPDTGVDDEAPRRRLSEHFNDEPLPYVEPAHTTPLALDDRSASEPAAAYSDVSVTAHPVEADEPAATIGRGTIDLGLLVLRVVVGFIFLLHGLQKLTTWGWVNGMGVDGFAGFLANNAAGQDVGLGFDSSAVHTLSLVGGITETVAGILLILGLLTPIAGAGVLGMMIVATTYLVTLAGGFSFFAGAGGFEFEYLLAAAAIAIILCGPGAYSIDRRWRWSRRPAWGSAAWLVIAIAAAVAVWIIFNGSNPLHGH